MPGGVFGGAGGFIGSAVSQKLGGGKVDWKKAWGAAANGAIIGAVQGGLVASGAGIPVALASNFMAGTVGSATEQLISEGKIDARKSITSGLTNAVSNAIYGTDPLKGVINAAVRGAGAGAATAGINYISDFIGQKPEWREMETGFLTGMAGKYISSYGGVERNPRRGCENISSFVKSTGYSLAKGYRYKVSGTSVIQKQKKFDFGEFLGKTVFGGVVGGFTSAGFYGAGKGIEKLKAGFRAGKGGSDVWDMTEGGGIINGREYSRHAMERMAPDTPSVRAELSRRAEALAESEGLQVGTPEYYQFCQKYVDPRNIPPSVIEDAIRNTTAVPGHTAGTFDHQTADVTVIVNNTGKVITVIPK